MLNSIIKAAGGLVLSLLFLGLVWFGTAKLYHMGPGDVMVDGKPLEQAYTVATADAPAAAAKAELTWDEAKASADAAKGEKTFSKCKACHKTDGKNAVGPHLDGVVNRPVASVADFNYGDAMKKHATEITAWDPESIEKFIADPKGVVPGTKMTFAGLKNIQDRADVVAYLETLK